RVTETHRETISVPITITNTNVKPDINVKSITTPEVIHPGEEFNITIELENTGKINAKELNLELISGVFEIKGKTNKVYLGELGINEITTANYTIITDAKTTPGIYTIELNMTYSDDNKTYNKKTDTGVLVDGTTDFKVFIQDISPDIITKDTEINALISIANTGIINAESVTIQINPCNDIKLGNVNQDFIGDLDTGDFTTTSFKFKPAKEGELKVGLTIEYMTPSGKKTTFNTTETIIINYSQAVTSAPKVTFSDVMLVIVAVMIIAYFLKKRRKSKK
ncbi:MAG TPA: CARDB domain-containing protein, partial [Candidatus Nanoarchaeia archaeon]|nr:CARDB domain-containing protein [Candidatus Nanoarchaeia archaeon]